MQLDNNLGSESTLLGGSRLPRLPIFILMLVVTMACFTTVDAAVIILARHTEALRDPFESYVDILPGQTRAAVTNRGFSCPKSSITAYHGSDEYCVLMPETGTFSQVGVLMSDGIIRQAVFILRADTLGVGDLVTFWGIPEVMSQYRAVNCVWYTRRLSISATCYDDGRVSIFRRIKTVYFSDVKLTK
jgi:hypothetical protein